MSSNSIDWTNVNISNSGGSTHITEEVEKEIKNSLSKEIETINMGTQPSTLRLLADSAGPSSSQRRAYRRRSEPQMEVPVKLRVIFHLIRHGQATHNNAALSPGVAATIHDPPLTAVGASQCLLLHENFPQAPYNSKADLILCSPLLRTRQTAFLAFPFSLVSPPSSTMQVNDTENEGTKDQDQAVKSKQSATDTKKIILWPVLKELGRGQCNTGLPLSQLLQELDPDIWDCSLITEGWEDEFREYTYGGGISEGRFRHVQQVRRELHALAKVLIKGGAWKGLRFEKWEEERDVEVVVVSHGNFLSTMCEFDRPKFHNTEWKTVAFPTEEAMRNKGWWKRMTETSLLQVEVEVKGVKVFRGGKAGLVPSRSSEAAKKAPRKSTRNLEEGTSVKGKELVVVDENQIVEDAGENNVRAYG